MSSQNLLEQIEKFQETYYSQSGKNWFFKSKQKLECAAKISEEFNLHKLIGSTIYLLSDTNRVFFDYTIFKLFANPENYRFTVNYVMSLFTHCIDKFGGFELHVNLNSFTITAAERYKSVIELFCNECLKSKTRYASMLTKMYIYNAPNMIEHTANIFGGLVDPLIRERLVIYKKEETGKKIEELFL